MRPRVFLCHSCISHKAALELCYHAEGQRLVSCYRNVQRPMHYGVGSATWHVPRSGGRALPVVVCCPRYSHLDRVQPPTLQSRYAHPLLAIIPFLRSSQFCSILLSNDCLQRKPNACSLPEFCGCCSSGQTWHGSTRRLIGVSCAMHTRALTNFHSGRSVLWGSLTSGSTVGGLGATSVARLAIALPHKRLWLQLCPQAG